MLLRSPARVACTLVALATLAACGSDSDSSSTTAAAATTAPASSPPVTASEELCQQREALKSSVEDLKDVDVVKDGTSGITDALTKIKDNAQAVKEAAGDDLKPQVQALQDAVDGLESAVKDVGSGGVAAVVTALRQVGTAGSTLLTSLDDLKC